MLAAKVLGKGTAAGLVETEGVFVFGFPFGNDMGKENTVNRSTVSNLRKSPAGSLQRVQLDGGLNPGNSGGPVVDGKGSVTSMARSLAWGGLLVERGAEPLADGGGVGPKDHREEQHPGLKHSSYVDFQFAGMLTVAGGETPAAFTAVT